MRLNAVYPRLHFWLGSALVPLMDAPPLTSKRITSPDAHNYERPLCCEIAEVGNE